jgi:hypothetical protein
MQNITLPIKSVVYHQENEFLAIFAIESYKNTCNNLRIAEGIFIKFYIGEFY